jgi:hypothetical protein
MRRMCTLEITVRFPGHKIWTREKGEKRDEEMVKTNLKIHSCKENKDKVR